MAAYPILQVAMKIPGARNLVVNKLGDMVARVLEPIIGKNQQPLSRYLVDKGLTLIKLETSEEMTKEQYLGATAANIVTEATDRILQLPNSILEAREDVLESFVKEAVLSSTANNVPSEVLNEDSLLLRQIPQDTSWGLIAKGKCKKLSKIYPITLNRKLAVTIHTGSRGKTVMDLARAQGWDGIHPIPIAIHIFEATPFTRLSMIAKNVFGSIGPDKIRQVAWLSPEAATRLINDSRLATDQRRLRPGSIAGLRFYVLEIKEPQNSRGSSLYIDKERPNDVNIRLISPKKVEVKLFFNNTTYKGIRNLASTIQGVELYKEIEFILLPITKKILEDFLTSLRIPFFAIKEIIARIQIWILMHLKSNLPKLVNDFLVEGSKDGSGTTITIHLDLPTDFLSNLTNLTTDKLGEFISELSKTIPSAEIKLVSGYNL